MQFKRNQFRVLVILLIALLYTIPGKAQVTIGSQTKPHGFSLLELISGVKRDGGLRLPELTTQQRDDLEIDKLTDSNLIEAAKGLTIYNLTTKCVEYWNSSRWVSFCTDVTDPPETVTVAPADTSVVVLNSATLRSTIYPSNIPVQYQWEVLRNGVWTVISGETASTLTVDVNRIGDTYYRVIAYNNAGSATSNEAVVRGIWPQPTNPNIQMYIGAYWRWSQTGERLIQFSVGAAQDNNYGNWTAGVVWYDDKWDPDNMYPDGVVLGSNGPVNFSSTANTNAENFQVPNGVQRLSGTVAVNGTISFRIGLNKKFADSATVAARYAVVLLSYNNGNKSQRLFIRQGEGADYVMRPGDPGTGVPTTPAVRPKAAKFIPYDVTDTRKLTPIDYDDATSLTRANSGFTDFPTKAGYFFVYGDNKAFAADIPPGNDPAVPPVGAWNQNVGWQSQKNGGFAYWDPSRGETCPNGYRRPSDGPNDATTHGTGTVANSEIRQSLWLNPPSGTNSNAENSTWGYYADGYFDRRQPVSSLGNTPVELSAVNTNSTEVAYEGRLFFNPTTNASLFFPAAGYRYWQNGALFNAGGRSRYWTSTSQSNDNKTKNAWFMYLYTTPSSTQVSMLYDDEGVLSDNSKTSGAMVRCVKE